MSEQYVVEFSGLPYFWGYFIEVSCFSILNFLSTDYVPRTSIDRIKEKERIRRYPAKTITDALYTDDIALLANASAQAETQLHSLERAAAGIGFHVNAQNGIYVL